MSIKISNNLVRNCKGCKKEFKPITLHQQYCTKECQHIFTLKSRRERHKKPLQKIEKCTYCGEPLIAYGSQKFCNETCRTEYRKLSRRKTTRINNKIIIPKILKKCLNCGEDIPFNIKYASTYKKKKFCSKKCANNYFKLHKEDFKGNQYNKNGFKIVIFRLLEGFVWEARKDNKTILKSDKSFNSYKECVKDAELAF
jgi:predicted nucleic acid-binding Zn ribbon protein